MKNFIRKLYWHMPFQFWTEYKTFTKTIALIQDTEFLSKQNLIEYQLEQLKSILFFAYNNIDGYKQLWNEARTKPNDLQHINDIKYFPFVTKELIQDNLKVFSISLNKMIKYETTGGSTGIPFGFYLHKNNYYIENAFIWDIWKRKMNKINYPLKSVILRGVKINDISYLDGKDGLYLSSYDICKENIKIYIKLIEKYRYPIFQAYPSAAYLFAKEIENLNIKINHRFKSIMLGSEPLYLHQRKLIKKVFNSPICHWYGQSEKVVLGGNCEHSNKFHIFPQYGLTEIINNKGEEVEIGETGEIVGTSFFNYATPFIRYKTKDLALKGNSHCTKCNRNYLVLDSIEGRIQELILGKTGKLISMTAINMHDNIFDEIKQFRFVQYKQGEIIFKFIKADKFTNGSYVKIKSGLNRKLGDEFDIYIEETTEIPGSINGKFKFLDQHLTLNL